MLHPRILPTLLYVLLLVPASSCASAQKSTASNVLVGPCTRTELEQPEIARHFPPIDLYPDPGRANALAEALDHKELILYLGTWCDDSRDQVPILWGELEAAGFPVWESDNPRWTMICVSEDKTEPAAMVSKRSIEYVPTLIVLQDGVELGRIVELPKIGWTEDLVKLVQP
jgi:hypothetical protein